MNFNDSRGGGKNRKTLVRLGGQNQLQKGAVGIKRGKEMLMCCCGVDRLFLSCFCHTNTSLVFLSPPDFVTLAAALVLLCADNCETDVHPIERHLHIYYNGITRLKVLPNDWSSTLSACLSEIVQSTRISTSIPAHKNTVHAEIAPKSLCLKSSQVAFSPFLSSAAFLTSLFPRR